MSLRLQRGVGFHRAAPLVGEDILFPFLSVLASLVGSITLLIAVSTLSSIGGPDAPVLRGPLAEAGRRIVESEAAVADLEREHAAADEIERELQAARAASERQLDQQIQDRLDLGLMVGRLAEIEGLRVVVADLDAELVQVVAELRALEELIEGRRRPRRPSTIRVEPAGSGRTLVPRFVECRSREIVLYGELGPTVVLRPDIAHSDDFRQFLRAVAGDDAGTITFLVRPSGVDCFRLAESTADAHSVRNGKLPIPEAGRVNFAAFNELRRER